MQNIVREMEHPAVAVHHEFGTANGKAQVVVTFSILEGPDKGRRIAWFGYFTEKTFERTMDSLRFCGWKGSDLDNLGALDQKVSLSVIHEEYEGSTNARVNWVNKFGGGMVKLKDPMSPDKLRMFAAEMREKAKQSIEVEGEKAKATQEVAPDNTEINPFDDPPPVGENDAPWDEGVNF